MENALRRIVEADRAAREDVEQAKRRRENLTAELSQSATEIGRQALYDEKSDEWVETIFNAVTKETR